MPGPRCHFTAMLPRCRCHVGPADRHAPLSHGPGNQEVKETFNKSAPSDDIALFSGYIADYTQKMVTYAGSAMNPEEYGKQIFISTMPEYPCPMN